MRILLLTLTLLGSTIGLRANKIDQLHTKQDVERFLLKDVSRKFKNFFLFEYHPGKDSNALSNSFFKLDINADGLTDLVVNCGSLWVIIDKGKETYSPFTLFQYGEMSDQTLIGIDSTSKTKKLVICRRYSRETILDTLAWQAGGFMEYNATPLEPFKFQGIKVSTTMCFGTCPVFEMSVDPEGKAVYHAIQYNDEKGRFKGTIPDKSLASMLRVLRYLPLDSLRDQYTVDWTDDQTITVEIRYNGKVKKIEDYGELGTFGLKRLYSFFFYWKKRVKWEKE
jgi:hypothetical protein